MFTRISTDEWSNIVTFVEDGCSSPSCFQGYHAETLFLLQSKLNFTFKITKTRSVGSEQRNDSWTGEIGKSRI